MLGGVPASVLTSGFQVRVRFGEPLLCTRTPRPPLVDSEAAFCASLMARLRAPQATTCGNPPDLQYSLVRRALRSGCARKAP